MKRDAAVDDATPTTSIAWPMRAGSLRWAQRWSRSSPAGWWRTMRADGEHRGVGDAAVAGALGRNDRASPLVADTTQMFRSSNRVERDVLFGAFSFLLCCVHKSFKSGRRWE